MKTMVDCYQFYPKKHQKGLVNESQFLLLVTQYKSRVTQQKNIESLWVYGSMNKSKIWRKEDSKVGRIQIKKDLQVKMAHGNKLEDWNFWKTCDMLPVSQLTK